MLIRLGFFRSGRVACHSFLGCCVLSAGLSAGASELFTGTEPAVAASVLTADAGDVGANATGGVVLGTGADAETGRS